MFLFCFFSVLIVVLIIVLDSTKREEKEEKIEEKEKKQQTPDFFDIGVVAKQISKNILEKKTEGDDEELTFLKKLDSSSLSPVVKKDKRVF